MAQRLIDRNALPLAAEVIEESPIAVISGARQVGKSTLMRQLLKGHPHGSSISIRPSIETRH